VPDGARRSARRGQTECPTGPDRVPDGGKTGWPDEVPDGWPDGVPDGARRSARRGWPDGVARRRARQGWTGCLTGARGGARRGPDGARRSARRARQGGGQKDYLLLKEKMTCSVYVSCKSSSASNVSDAG
jgi:hypothetical protein